MLNPIYVPQVPGTAVIISRGMGRTAMVRRMSLESNIAVCEANYERLLAFNDRFDAKVTVLLTLATAVLGAVGTVASNLPMEHPLCTLCVSIACVGPLRIVLEISRGSVPRLYTRPSELPHEPPKSLIFFGTIASLPKPEFARQVSNRSAESHLADLVSQQHINSQILSVKFGHLARAHRFMFWSYAALVPLVALMWWKPTLVAQTNDGVLSALPLARGWQSRLWSFWEERGAAMLFATSGVRRADAGDAPPQEL